MFRYSVPLCNDKKINDFKLVQVVQEHNTGAKIVNYIEHVKKANYTEKIVKLCANRQDY